jgi:sec-independent protein translocase protein TatC
MTVTAIRSITHTSFRRISNSSNIVRNNYKNGRKLNAAAAYRKRKISEIPRATSSSSPPPSSDANGEGGEGQKQMLESAMDGAGESSATTSTNTFKTSITEDPNFLRGLESSTSSSSSSTSQSQPSSSPLSSAALSLPDEQTQKETVRSFLYPGEEELPDDVEMSIWEHLEELRDRALVSSGAVAACILLCFCFAKDLVIFLEKPVSDMGVRFLQLGPGEYFFTTVKVAGYTGILLAAPVVLYEIIAYVLPGLTKKERKILGPIVLGSSVLFYIGIYFAYLILTPAALKFFVGYADGAVESLWSIDQYFEFVLVLLFSTGLSFQVPVIQLLLGQTGIVSSKQMLSAWKFVIVGSVIAAAVLTPSTDPFTQMLLAIPLMSLYFGGAALVGVVEREREMESSS